MHAKIVLRYITWKENTNQKVSDWGYYCAKFWMNAGTEVRKYAWKSSIFRNAAWLREWVKNAWTSRQMRPCLRTGQNISRQSHQPFAFLTVVKNFLASYKGRTSEKLCVIGLMHDDVLADHFHHQASHSKCKCFPEDRNWKEYQHEM